jgi:hypothetical protein
MTSGLDVLVADLKAIFASRLQAVVLYGPQAIGPKAGHPAHALVIVGDVGLADLEAAARRIGAWRREGLAVPLLMSADEFASSMDAFPVEIGVILGGYRVVYGVDPFEGVEVDPADLRRACEVEARGHLLHLREGYIAAGGRPDAVARLVEASAPALRTLLVSLARLDGATEQTPSAFAASRLGPHHGRTIAGVLSTIDGPLAVVDPARDFEQYLAAASALVTYVDGWAS